MGYSKSPRYRTRELEPGFDFNTEPVRLKFASQTSSIHTRNLFSLKFEADSYFLKFPKIDLFSLYALFSRLRPGDGAPKNCFFQMSSYALATTYEKTKNKFPGEHHIIWIEKQNIQAKEVYFCKLGQMRQGITTHVCYVLKESSIIHVV